MELGANSMELRQASALRFLRQIVAAQSGQEEAGLESLRPDDTAESLRTSVSVREEDAPLVARTIDKISTNTPLDPDENFALEAIIIPDQRPVLDVLVGNTFTTDHLLWQDLLSGTPHKSITEALPAVGRVELPGHPSLPYGGTGFIVGPGLLMTNRHVAEIFASGIGQRDLMFRPGLGAAVDLEQRIDGGSRPCTVGRVVMIHPYWDMAILDVDGLPEEVEPLTLASANAVPATRVAAIGYPAFDPRNDTVVQQKVFRGVYNVKRIMPGLLTGTIDVSSFGKTVRASAHDSSTLGGASGSAVVDLDSGSVVALHFGGAYLKSNYGVPTAQLALDSRVIDTGLNFSGNPRGGPVPWERFWTDVESPPAGAARTMVSVPAPPFGASGQAQDRRVSIRIPLSITVDVGEPSHRRAMPRAVQPTATADVAAEAPIADYRDREGYRPGFLGEEVPLPEVAGSAHDVLTFDLEGKSENELRYEHFSVVMSRSRRLCFFSAVNIDGNLSRKSRRVGWRTDPRVPAGRQVLNECYGNPPRFSRGHMTRREDPVWGDEETANRGNADSMHVTNAVPQMQAFNSPIWLGLEDYALEHARRDDMRISVFTGPYFRSDDPIIDGVAIPVEFWKVIAFIHDETGKLCATGYEMDQSGNLPRAEEFIFGDFISAHTSRSTQTSIRAIEQRSGLLFGPLADLDPLASEHESLSAGPAAPLEQFEQIRFI